MKKTSIGGQALIEGVMMRGPSKISMAVRTPQGSIENKTEEITGLPSQKYKILRLPIIRGSVAMLESMYIGINSLLFSASFYDEEEEEMSTLETVGVVLFSVLLSIGLFMILPNVITSVAMKSVDSVLLLNIVEGAIRLVVFFIYLVYISKIEDMYRVFQYHGAEHKTIHAYENGEELTVENVMKYPIEHKRCGTSFLFMVMIISVIVLSFFGWPNMVMRIVTRIIALPIIAGLSYEINKYMGAKDNLLCSVLSKPGMFMQTIATVKEPTPDMIEVAIASLKPVLPREGEDDSW